MDGHKRGCPVYNEGGREIRSITHHIVFGTQIIRKIFFVPLQFFSEHLMLSSEPLNLKSMKKCFMSYLIFKTNSVDSHDGVHFVVMSKKEGEKGEEGRKNVAF